MSSPEAYDLCGIVLKSERQKIALYGLKKLLRIPDKRRRKRTKCVPLHFNGLT
jgi:hypothetical protein